ncbi:hypothetical protein [Martelella alba]|uniref:Uncharacterized protein n=1 Tax=Martelella alba TaxID=2590451 RepID=A0ABY2SGJ7_9HYPH|nr:hypothetical protein [Martelella alba]TKI03573.1 hypothetical protein FCN80_21075 [Martelella alba]
MAFTPYAFTDAQVVDIRRYCGYPAYGDGAVVFPYPWIMRQYLALEYRLQHMSDSEGAVIVNTYLTNLNTLENAIPTTSDNLDTDKAAVWTHNKDEQRDRDKLFDSWRLRLCNFLGVPPGPNFGSNKCCVSMVV